MIFLQAMWHSLKVVGTALYWLLTVCFVWAGLAQLGNSWGWSCLALVAGLFVLRRLIVPKYVTAPAGYLIGCGAYAVFMAVAQTVTGHMYN